LSNKTVFTFFSVFLIINISSLNSEIINKTKLSKKTKPFKISRDLFNPKKNTQSFINKKKLEKIEAVKINREKLKIKHQELFDNIIFEGFVIKKTRKTALLNINGEYITCKVGDTILEKIRIKDITKDKIEIIIDNKKYEIKIKGDENEE
jgi:hypothetical protein